MQNVQILSSFYRAHYSISREGKEESRIDWQEDGEKK